MTALTLSRDFASPRIHSAWMPTLVACLLLCGGSIASAATITVDTTADEFGGGSFCSLREAVHSANNNSDATGCTHTGTYGTDTIILPSGFYTLTRGDFASFTDIDEDSNGVIDIDISSSLTLQGNAANPPSIGNLSGNYRGRILQVISGVVTLSNVVLRDGENPSGRFGGGLRSNPGSTVTLNNVRVFGNTADGGGGGILNGGTMTLNNCLVDSNNTTNAFEGGGGIYNQGSLTLNDSRVLSNRTEGNGANGNGAGIYNEANRTLLLDNTTVDGNVIQIGGVVSGNVAGDGGGIYSLGSVSLVQSTISNNVAAGNHASGGGIVCDGTSQTQLQIELSLIFANRSADNPDVSADNPGGGGIVSNGCSMTLRNSIVSANTGRGLGGGLELKNNGTQIAAVIENSLIVGNHSDTVGGGIFVRGFRLTLDNSTVLNNTADDSGGGIHAAQSSSPGQAVTDVVLASSTIVGNTSNADGTLGGNGGGLFADVAGVDFRNSLLAGNLANGAAIHDDCSAAVASLGHNLIQTATGCVLSGGGGTDALNVNARLAAATNNGGPLVGASNGISAGMLTRAPLADSPLIDAGNPSGCRTSGGIQFLVTDQLGTARALDGPDAGLVATCDIGAIEFRDADRIFAHGFE